LVFDRVTYNGKITSLCEILLEIKHNNQSLFVGVEQGAGKHKKDVLIMTIATMRIAAQRWVNENYRITVLFQH